MKKFQYFWVENPSLICKGEGVWVTAEKEENIFLISQTLDAWDNARIWELALVFTTLGDATPQPQQNLLAPFIPTLLKSWFHLYHVQLCSWPQKNSDWYQRQLLRPGIDETDLWMSGDEMKRLLAPWL